MSSTTPRSPRPAALRDRIAVVAGATRGAGRGSPAALGEAGATVYAPDAPADRSPPLGLRRAPETIEETAELVTGLGGTGIAVAVDHLDPMQVAGPRRSPPCRPGPHRRAGHRHLGRRGPQGRPAGVEQADLGDRSRQRSAHPPPRHRHPLITAHALLPLVVAAPGGLLVEVTDGTGEYNADHYRISVYYDLVKTAVNRLAWTFGHELGPHGATAVVGHAGLAPVRDDARGLRRHRGPLARRPMHRRASRSPSRRGSWAEGSWRSPPIPTGAGGTSGPSTADLAVEYGVTDLDGTQPDAWAVTP